MLFLNCLRNAATTARLSKRDIAAEYEIGARDRYAAARRDFAQALSKLRSLADVKNIN
jgi:hypothetical protein